MRCHCNRVERARCTKSNHALYHSSSGQKRVASRFLLPLNANRNRKRRDWIFVRALGTILSCDLALGFMRDGDMRLSLGIGAEAVNLSRAARILRLGVPGTHESD